MISYILFDLDNTLYPESSGFQDEISRRMTTFVAHYLSVPEEKAAQMRRLHSPRYGTTLKWLIAEYDFSEVEDFLEAVHPKDIHRFIEKNHAIQNMLENLPQKMSLLTNSPAEHALRVIQYLEIERFFELIFDIRYHNFTGKPAEASYLNVLQEIGLPPDEVLFIDDVPQYLVPFRRMGGHVLLIDEMEVFTESGLPSIRGILDLPEYLGKIG